MRFDVSGAVTTGSPAIYKLYNQTDNPTYYNTEGTEPTRDQWLTGFIVTTDAAAKIEIGLTNTDKSSFTPIFPIYSTMVAAGGIAIADLKSRYLVQMTHATIKFLAIRVTVAENATVKAGGEVNITQR